jgi:xylulokinase
MALVAGVDSSTQSCKVVVRDVDSGALVRAGRAAHPQGSEVDPQAWYDALVAAVRDAGGLRDIAALAVAGQQHGMVLLSEDGSAVRDALLWNDTRSAPQAADLVADLGAGAWAEAVGSVPVASFTVTNLRWVADNEPGHAARTAAVCLPHDWLTWRLRGGGPGRGQVALTTDRGDASGTGYWSPATGDYRPDLLELAFGSAPALPEVLGPAASPGGLQADGQLAELTADGTLLAAGTGDNIAAALGLGLEPGDVVVSIGTSGTATAVADHPSADPTGAVAGFADATGRYLPLVCTLNAARVLDAGARLLGVDHAGFDALALAADPGAQGLVLVPYLEGERTPNRPDATGYLAGMTAANTTPANLARAMTEGMLCGLADAVDALAGSGVRVDRVLLIGGGAQSAAVRAIAPAVLGRPVLVPAPGEYVAAGAARQAAWALLGQPPSWPGSVGERFEAPSSPEVRAAYSAVRG